MAQSLIVGEWIARAIVCGCVFRCNVSRNAHRTGSLAEEDPICTCSSGISCTIT